MDKLIEGVKHFHDEVFPQEREMYEGLAGGQTPRALFITCSDSRIDPNHITQSGPGELFVIRNAGNIVPPYLAGEEGGEGPTIEYALTALKVRSIIVCGHTDCGAMKGLLHPEKLAGMPEVADWLRTAETTRRLTEAQAAARTAEGGEAPNDAEMARLAAEQNVLVQLQNLRTHPAVATALSLNQVTLYGWMFHIGTGSIETYEPAMNKFVPLEEASYNPNHHEAAAA